jgi:site-specific DNA-methyltransferase (adenine-specific)
MGQGCGINVGQNSNLLTAPSSDLAKQYDGYGTALKPAVELFTLVRKPISESTIAKNVIKWGTGGINIDACRVSVTDREQYQSNSNRNNVNGWWRTASSNVNIRANDLGRFPANLIHDGSQEVLDLFPVTKLPTKQHDANVTNDKSRDNCVQFSKDKHQFNYGKEDSNSASRFFYCAKASPAEKNKGLIETKNIHPTVKPVALMQYLCRLITPANGIVLDPFIGSGTTAIAAINEGFSYIGIELDSNYYEIAKNRVKSNYLEIELFE